MTTTTGLPAPTDDLDRAEHDLGEHGICAVAGVLQGERLRDVQDALRTAAAQDRARGRNEHFAFDRPDDHTNQRVWNLPSRSPDLLDLVDEPVALRLLRSVLSPSMLLSNFSANITGPGGGEMALHADQLFVPEPWPPRPQGANAAWCVTDFTADNGATCFVPGSHRANRNPRPDEVHTAVPMEAPAGTLVVFDSRVWHRTGFNRTGFNGTRAEHRYGAFAWYTRHIYRTQENWFLALDPSVAQFASDDRLALLGYRTAGFGMVNGHSPR